MNGMVIIKTIKIMYLKKMYQKQLFSKSIYNYKKFNDYFPTKNDLHNKRDSLRSGKLTANIWEHKNLQNKLRYFFKQLMLMLILFKEDGF